MRRVNGYITLNITIAMVLAGAGSQSAMAGTITDGFEGATISPLWTAYGPGSEVLTNATAYAGSQSVLLTASSSYPWDADLTHDFGAAQYGTVSVYVQTGLLCCNSSATFQVDGDLPAGQDTIAAIYRQANGSFFAYNGATFSSSFNSPNPGGWDQLEIVASASGISMLFDGTTVYTSATETSGFQYVVLAAFGGPGGSEYFDNFSATTSVTPEPSASILFGCGLVTILIWRRVRMGSCGARIPG